MGALEQQFYRYAEHNPVHFSIAAEFDVALDENRVRSALDVLQRRHPLLSVHVVDHPESRLTFERAAAVAPISLHVHRRPDADWQALAAEDLARPFDRSTAPLMRATLVSAPEASTLVLTFDHTIADGISSVEVVDDLLGVLNGRQLSALPVPPSQEDMIARLPDPSDEAPTPAAPAADPRMAVPTSVRPFDGVSPDLHTVAMTPVDTSHLVDRCRSEKTTVHAAILTAAAHVRARRLGQHYVRVLSPINFRSVVGAGGDCAAYFSCACTGTAPAEGTFWDQARTLTAQFTVARSAAGVRTFSAAMQQCAPVDADAAHHFFTHIVPWDLLVTNLGVQDLETSGPIRPTALWGPIVRTHVNGDAGIGVLTYEGRLRMISCGYTPVPEFLDDVVALLRDTCGGMPQLDSTG
ncbi:condensation domain-containing protein [Mycolicibacterium sp. P1-18]|uniref:condensation domain-containing protein n=1 Tax=Mycolicibacterium sp. P1-18 TaxID=2024615 RepID=UPI001F5B498B|nr:condensation domain-containing protein [Mycolicibacterium sp. P1-18]